MCVFEQTMNLRMRMNARSHHAKSPKINKQSSLGILSLGNAFIATINNELHQI